MRKSSSSPVQGLQVPSFGVTFRDGKISAVEQLTAAYGGRVYGVAREILQDDEAAQDAAADALRLILEQRDAAPDDMIGVGRWWLAATRLAALDRKRGRLHDPDSTRPLVPALKTSQRTLQAALLTLPPEQRESLALVVQEGATVAEASRRLNLPIPVIVTRLRDGMALLHAALSPAGTEASGTES